MRSAAALLLGALLLANINIPKALAAEDPLAKDVACKESWESPVCVAKTALACLGLGGNMCSLVGLSEPKRGDQGRPDLGDISAKAHEKPWEITVKQLGEATWETYAYQLDGVRAVTPARYASPTPVPEKLRGTHEVMIANVVADDINRYSFFVSKEAGRWVLKSWHYSYSGWNPEPYVEYCAPSYSSCDKYARGIKHYGLAPK
jgi:hypothetical protein